MTGRSSSDQRLAEVTGWPHTPAWTSRLRIALGVVAALLAATCVATLVIEATARRTVLDANYYQRVLDREHAYDRLYDQVLVDPAAAPVTRDLLARLPVPQETVLSNLKVVLPPTTLRHLVNEQINAAVQYLRGDTAQFALRVDLAPVVANLTLLARNYLGDLVASVQRRDEPDFAAFMRSLNAAVDDIARGQRFSSLPSVQLTKEQRAAAQRALLAVVPAADRAGIRPVVAAALATGDVATALATVGPYALSGRVGAAHRDLAERAGGQRWDVVPNLHAADAQLGAVHAVRSFSTALRGWIRLVAVLVGLCALAFLWWITPVSRRLFTVGLALAAGGLLAFVAMLVVRWQVRRLITTPPGDWPPSLRTLATDLQHAGAGSLFSTGLLLSAIPLIAGVLVVGGSWLARHWPTFQLYPSWREVAIGTVAVAIVAGIAYLPVGSPAVRCLGSTRMCSLRYDQTTFLATHNSMATTQAGFIAPLQDPNIISQLDEGARALLIDTHTWETPDEITHRLESSDLPGDLKSRLPDLINKVNPPKPGLWLCHAVCRAGAEQLIPTLIQLRKWLETNRGEVVTLIIQDGITGEQTARAFAQAGLNRLTFTPPADPHATWPTLGKMVRSNRRLVVFAEEGDGPAHWYRNFYQYGMETPFAASSPRELTCDMFRGAIGKRLFLLNHFITRAGGSRLDAAEVNSRKFVLDRVRRCQKQRDAIVNFIAVDYASLGDALGAVETLNNERLSH